jgi:hypothetical protein
MANLVNNHPIRPMASRVTAKATFPNLLVIGAAKAGTTSLHRYLSLHPQIFMSKKKELAFFDTRLRWQLGVDWYKSNFDASFPINGETSPQYTLHPRVPGVPERIRDVLGTPKLIYMIRDPIDRILSNYTQTRHLWPTSRPFNAARLEIERPLYIYGSSYFLQLSQYLRVFPPELIHVVVNERLNAQPRETVQQIFRFIGVDDHFWAAEFEERANVGEKKKSIAGWFDKLAPQSVKQQLAAEATLLPWKAHRALRWISELGGDVIQKPKLTHEQDLRLQDILKADVMALRKLLGDPFKEWRPYA